MRTFFSVLILSVAGMVWAFPSPSVTSHFVSKASPELIHVVSTQTETVEPQVEFEVGEANWSRGNVTVFDNSRHRAQLKERLEHLRKLNAPPPAPEGIVISITTTVTQEVNTDRRVHTQRQRTARQGHTSSLPDSD